MSCPPYRPGLGSSRSTGTLNPELRRDRVRACFSSSAVFWTEKTRGGVVWCGVVAAVRAEYDAAGRKQSYLAGAQAVDVDEGATNSRVSPRSIRVELLTTTAECLMVTSARDQTSRPGTDALVRIPGGVPLFWKKKGGR